MIGVFGPTARAKTISQSVWPVLVRRLICNRPFSTQTTYSSPSPRRESGIGIIWRHPSSKSEPGCVEAGVSKANSRSLEGEVSVCLEFPRGPQPPKVNTNPTTVTKQGKVYVGHLRV